MLSGIGAAAHLLAHDIPVIAELPGVGQDRQDYVGGGAVRAALKEPLDVGGQATDFDVALAEFEGAGAGQLATLHLDAGTFLRLDLSDPDPDFKAVFTPCLADLYHSYGQPEHTRVYVNDWVSGR